MNNLSGRCLPPDERDVRRKLAVLLEEHRLRYGKAALMDLDEEEEGFELQIGEERKKVHRNVAKKLKRKLYNWKPLRLDSPEKCFVYAAARFSGNFAVTARVLKEIKQRDTDFTPATVLDVGSGVGTSFWALNYTWPNNAAEFTMVDVNNHMNNLAHKLIKVLFLEKRVKSDMSQKSDKALVASKTYEAIYQFKKRIGLRF